MITLVMWGNEMFTVPQDFQSGPFQSKYRSIDSMAGCVVMYHAVQISDALPVLFTRATLVHVRRGTKLLRSSRARELVQVEAGSVVLMSPGSRFMSEFLDDDELYESTVICFEPDFLAQTIPELVGVPLADDLPRWVCDPDPYVSTVVSEFSERLQDMPGERILSLRLQEMALALWQSGAAAESVLAHAVWEGHGEASSRLKHVMQQHFNEPLQLRDYASLCGRSLSSFKRDFKRLFGVAPGDWLVAERLAHAAHLLEEDVLNVTEVCMASGFGHLSHFIRAFGKVYQMSPKQYQLQMRKERDTVSEASSLKTHTAT